MSEICDKRRTLLSSILGALPKIASSLTLGIILLGVIASGVTLSRGDVSISFSPSTVYGSPGAVFNVTMIYSANDYIEIYFYEPIVNNNGTIIHPIHVSNRPSSITGSGQVELEISTSTYYAGVFEIPVKAFINGELQILATLTIDLTQPPTATISSITSTPIKEIKWFPCQSCIPPSETGHYVIMGHGNITLSISGLNPGAMNSNILVNGTADKLVVSKDSLRFEPGTERVEIVLNTRLKDYIEPGSYDVSITIRKEVYQCTYDEAFGHYIVYDNTVYVLANTTTTIEVIDVNPPPYVWASDGFIRDLDFDWYSEDSLFLKVELNATVDAYAEESCLSCFDPFNFPFQKIYTNFLLLGAVLYMGDKEVFGVGAGADTRTNLNFGDAYWITVHQTTDKQSEFPYMYIRTTSGKIGYKISEEFPLTLENLLILSRTYGAKVVLRLLNHHPGTDHPDFIKEYVEVYHYRYEPPFYSVMDATLNVNDLKYAFRLQRTASGTYYFQIPVSLDLWLDVGRIVGDKYFENVFQSVFDLPETSSDTGLLVVSVELIGAEDYQVGQIYRSIQSLEEGRFEGTSSVQGTDIGVIPFTVRKNYETGKYEPYEATVRRSWGNISFSNLLFGHYFTLDELRTIHYLYINISIIDKIFNKTIASYDETIDVSSYIQEYLKEAPNMPPKPKIAYKPLLPSINEETVFTSESTDPDGKIVNTRWTITDENGTVVYEATGTTVTHVFTKPGTYTVMLIVEDDMGAVANTSLSINVLGGFLIVEETDVDIGGIPPTRVINPASVTVKIEHVATGTTKTIAGRNPFTIKDVVYLKPNMPYQGLFEITVKIGDGQAYPEIHLWLDILIYQQTGFIDVNIIETWNTWVKDSQGTWRPVIRGGVPVSAYDGAVLRTRSYELWEEIYLSFLERFLIEAGFTTSNVGWLMSNVRIRHVTGAHPSYEYWSNTIILPSTEEMFCLSYLPGTQTYGWYNRVLKNGIRCDEAMEDFYHEFAHAVKYNFYAQQDIMQKILDYLGTGGEHSIDEPFPALFGIQYLSSIGAYDEGHSEFLATLIVEYIRGTQYYNTTLPVFDRARFYDDYDAQHVFQKPGGTSFYGEKYHGYTVEGRVAGSLLAILYGAPDSSLGANYKSRPMDAVKAYRYFLDGIKFIQEYLHRTPVNIKEALYGLLVAHPELFDKAVYYASPAMYNLELTINQYTGTQGLVWGRPVLLVPGFSNTIMVQYQDGDVLKTASVNSVVLFRATPYTKITITSTLGAMKAYRFIITDPATAQPVLLVEVRGLPSSYIQFHRGGIRLAGTMQAYIDFMNGSSITVSGSNFIVVPHSSIVIRQDDASASVVVVEGSVELITASGNKEEISEGYNATINRNGEITSVTKIELQSLPQWWLEPYDVNISESTYSAMVKEEPLWRAVKAVSGIVIEPGKNVMSGDRIKIIIYLNSTVIEEIGVEETITVLIKGKNGEILARESYSITGTNTITMSYAIPLLYTGSINIEVYMGDKELETFNMRVALNYVVFVIIAIIIVLATAAIVYVRRRMKHQ